MASQILQALASGYSSRAILNQIARQYPQYAKRIDQALLIGYTADTVLKKFIDPNKPPKQEFTGYLTEVEKRRKSEKSKDLNQKTGLIGAVGTAGAIAAGLYYYQNRNRAIYPSEILPASPQRQKGAPPQLPGAAQKQLPYNPQQPPQGPAPTQGGPRPRSPQGGAPNALGTPNTPIIPPYEHDPEQNVAIIENIGIGKQVASAITSGLAPAAVMQLLRQTLPKNKLAVLDRAPGGFEQAIQDYGVVVHQQQAQQGHDQALQQYQQHQQQVQAKQAEEKRKQSLIDEEIERFERGYGRQEQLHTEPQRTAGAVKENNQNNDFNDLLKKETALPTEVSKNQNKLQKTKSNNKTKILDLSSSDTKDMQKLVKDVKIFLTKAKKTNEFNESDVPQNMLDLLDLNDKDFKREITNNYAPENTLNPIGVLDNEDWVRLLQKIYPNVDFISTPIGQVALKEQSSNEIERVIEKEEKESQEAAQKSAPKPIPIEEIKDVVITPNGPGEIEFEGKEGIIADVNGKQKSYRKDDYVKTDKEIIKAVQNILNIPEVDKSSNIVLFLYNPKDAEMYVQFHDGSTYKYYDVDPDKVYRIANKMGIPITKGQNIYGAWSQEDRRSLGAAFHKEILKDPKYKKAAKGQPPNPNYYKLETLYDYWEKLRKKPKKKKPKEKKPKKKKPKNEQ
jgi:hypothetical protein